MGTADDYLSRRQDNAPMYAYRPSDLCLAYDPYCFTPQWYLGPVYYSPHDRDADCDHANCGTPFIVDHLKVERLARLRALNHQPGRTSVGGAHFATRFGGSVIGGHGRR